MKRLRHKPHPLKALPPHQGGLHPISVICKITLISVALADVFHVPTVKIFFIHRFPLDLYDFFFTRMIGVTWMLAGAVLVLLWAYSRWKHRFWESKGVPTPPVVPFIGHMHNLLHPDKKTNFEGEVINVVFCALLCYCAPTVV